MPSKTQALVIGNGSYSPDLRLGSPGKDALAVAERFRDLDINVTLAIDHTFDEASQKVDEFLQQVALPSTLTSILYYSGHGIQIENENYIVPVDFDRFATENVTKLISVQAILNRMATNTAVRVVLLDACRNNDVARTFIGGKGLQLTGIKKSFFVNGQAVAQQGLAEIKANGNTFIAFAAAPGDVAYDGTTELSPFTSAFVKHLEAVDLPLSNLTSRIRRDVLTLTDGKQRTWDQSSLMAPFYFNPGSLLLFAGNFMALLGLALSLLIYSLAIATPRQVSTTTYIVGAALLPVVCLAIFLFGAQSAYSRLRGRFETDIQERRTLWKHVLTSLQKGMLGGYLGSLLAAIFLSIPYYWAWKFADISLGQLMVEIAYGTALAACPLGVATFFCARVALWRDGVRLIDRPSAWHIFGGSCLGGVIAGALSAPILTFHFARLMDRPQMTPEFLLPGAIGGSAVIVFTIVNFDFERLTRRRVWTSVASAILALLAGGLASIVVFGPLYLLGVVHLVINYLEEHVDDPVGLVVGGFIYGIPVGLVLGSVIGSAIVLTQTLSRKPIFT